MKEEGFFNALDDILAGSDWSEILNDLFSKLFFVQHY